MPSGLFAFSELLEVANQRAGKRYFTTTWVGQDTHPISLGGAAFTKKSVAGKTNLKSRPPNLTLTPELSLLGAELDGILLPGMWVSSATDLKAALPSLQELIGGLARLKKNTQVLSYCTSVSLAAQAGKLKGAQVTSTWWLAHFYKTAFEGLDWHFNQTCIFDKNVATASGVNGYLPIALGLIEKHCGEKVLREVTNIMLLPRPETEQQAFQDINLMALNDTLMVKIFLWVENMPANQLSTSMLAGAMMVSERTLARKIKSATGYATMHFMRLIKLNQASEELILTQTPISVISEQLGYLDDGSFRRTFKAVTGHSPSEYRQTFKRSQPNVNSG